jgi:glycosyltransferase involved in cell wall biosynthesis
METKGLFKIAIIRGSTSFQSITNYNSQEIGLAKALLKKGIHTDIFYASDTSKSSLIQIDHGINVNYLPVLRIAGQQGIMMGINRYIKTSHYKLIQVSEHNSLSSFFAAVCARKNAIPVVLLQGVYEPYKKLFAATFQKGFNLLFSDKYRKCISATICKTNKAKEFLQLNKHKNLNVIPIGLSVEKFDTSNHEIITKPSKYVVLYVGKLEDRRNPFFTLELAKNYLHNKDVTFICIGKGPLTQAIKRDKPNNVKIIDVVSQEEIQAYYKIADVLLMPTNYEIFGMVYLEAIFFGVPIITTENAGSLDILKNKKYAFLEKTLEVNKWKEKIDTFLFDTKIIAKAKRYLAEDKLTITWDRVVDKYIMVYKNLLKRRN